MEFQSNKYLFAAFALIAGLLGLVSYLNERAITRTNLDTIRHELRTELDIVEETLRDWYREQHGDASAWAGTREISTYTQRLLAARARGDQAAWGRAQAELRAWLAPIQTAEGYQGYAIIAPDGTNLASSRSINVGVPTLLLSQPGILEQVWDGAAVVSFPQPSDVALPDHAGQLREGLPTLFAVAPVRDGEGHIVAAFAFRIDFFTDYSKVFKGLQTAHGSESLAYRDDGRLVADSRYEDLLRKAAPLGAEQPSLWNTDIFVRTAADGARVAIPFFHDPTSAETVYSLDGFVNHQGSKVIGVRRWVPELQLGIAQEIAYDEVFRILEATRKTIWSLTAFALVLLTALVYFIVSGRRRIAEAQARMAAIVETADDAIISIDTAERILLFNPAAQEIFGYAASEIIGAPLSTLIPTRYREQHHVHVKNIFADPALGRIKGRHLVGLRKSGEEFPIETTITRQRVGGEPVLTVSLRDISQQLQAEEALRAEQNKARHYLDSVEALLIALDVDGKVQLINRKACELLGLREEEILGKDWFVLCRLQPKEYEDTRLLLQELLNNNLPGGIYHENSMVTGAGNEYVIGWHSSILSDTDGKPIGYLCGGLDLTQVKQGEVDRQRLQRQLLRVQKAESIGQLTGGIAHDFNNMLASISGYTELSMAALDPQHDARLLGYLAQVQHTCRRAADLVTKLLAFSRGGESELQLVYLPDVIQASLKMLDSVLPSSIDIRFTPEQMLPAVMVDPVQIDQLVVNLCINARDAMNGQGRLDIQLRDIDVPRQECISCHKSMAGRFIELKVSDSGSGIDPGLLEKIFDPFYTTKPVGKGTGMGLSQVHGIVHSHGGHIQVANAPGGGAEFRLYFPIAFPNGMTQEPLSTAPATTQQLHPGTMNAERHILLVDDQQVVTDMLRQVLEVTGFRVSAFTDSREALAAFKAEPQRFDLLLTDQTMPHMTGVELSKTVLALRPDLPVVLCTGYSAAVDERTALALGIRAYFEKPMDTAKLVQKLMEILQVEPQQGNAPRP